MARSILAQQALSLQMEAGVGFGMLHLKLRGQKGQEEHRVINIMLKQQLQAPGLIFTAETGGVENRACSSAV